MNQSQIDNETYKKKYDIIKDVIDQVNNGEKLTQCQKMSSSLMWAYKNV